MTDSTESTLKRRRSDTFASAFNIHGATKSNKKPVFDGLFDTLNKKCKTDVLGNYVLSNKRLTTYVIKKKSKQERAAFEASEANVLRSIATYYSAGVMGKRKYKSVRLASSMKLSAKKRGGRTALNFMPKCPIPKLLTYDKLSQEVKKINIGTLYTVEHEFEQYIEEENVNGCFRDLREFLPRLANFYLNTYGRNNALKWFGKTEGTFLVAFGGDAAPFGKNETDCSFLVSFLNTGKRVASSNDNFLVFGANCDKTSSVVKKYIQAVCKQIVDLEGKVVEICGLHCTFHFEEIPNDMKMLAMLGGELLNSATFFSTFANVSKNDSCDLKGSFGNDQSCKWKPWSYGHRVEVAKEVKDFKASLANKNLSEKLKRSKVTEFIARKKSRQALVGKLIDKAHVEPLHLKNNAWQYFFRSLLKEAVGKSNLPPACKSFVEVPKNSCFARLVTTLQNEVKAKRLTRKVKKWFDETEGKKGDLQYRFTGKTSRLFCHNFMTLVKSLSQEEDSQKQKQTILVLSYIGLRLRDCCSIFNRFEAQQTDISTFAQEYYRANALFQPSSVNPTVWTIGHVVPMHAQFMFDTYGQGLLTVTMEGREAKHIALHRLSLNTTYQQRWREVFRHEFIMLIWLPEHGYESSSYSPSKNVYIPSRVFNDSSYCYCGLKKASQTDRKCCFCNDKLMSLIDDSVHQGKIIRPGLV